LVCPDKRMGGGRSFRCKRAKAKAAKATLSVWGKRGKRRGEKKEGWDFLGSSMTKGEKVKNQESGTEVGGVNEEAGRETCKENFEGKHCRPSPRRNFCKLKR